MTQHLWFIGKPGSGKSTLAKSMFEQSPDGTKMLSGQTTLNGFASLFRQITIPSRVIIDIDTEDNTFTWACILSNATTCGHMVHTKGMRWRLKIPPQCQIVAFSPALSETWRTRLFCGKGRFLFTDLSEPEVQS